jgi:phenylpropionate dioxygenase-like ring-hydroxylating dioxygenase large terminal subunit
MEPTPSSAGDATARFSVAFPRRHWYPACESGDLGSAPLAVELMEQPVVLYRDRAGQAHALVDRCPHRNAPLSLGRVDDRGHLQCGYHGWCFDGAGACTAVPGLEGEPGAANRSVATHAVAESDGFVWIWGEPGSTPSGSPLALPKLQDTDDRRRVGRTVFVCDLESTMHAAIENALDVPHTAFLHGGIFRGRAEPREITAVRRELPNGVEVEYQGEPIGFGPLTLSSRQTDRTFEHFDRFLLPSIAQIEYAVPGWLRIVNTILHLPMGPFRTRAWFVLDFSSPLPPRAAAAVIRARGRAVLRQDADMLAAQTATIRRFGGERYSSTDLDLLGRAIWRLLRQAERAESDDADRAPEEAAEPDGVTVKLRI